MDSIWTETPIEIDQYLMSLERELLYIALGKTRQNSTQAAKDLGITFRSFRYRTAKTGLRVSDARFRVVPADFGRFWPKLRMDAIRKYGNRCQCCGAAPNDGAVIEVDHIKPRHRYPHLAFDLDNLQVLCSACHQSKGLSEDDWREKRV